jgi:peptidoglycan hydrolase CwlO-like protein
MHRQAFLKEHEESLSVYEKEICDLKSSISNFETKNAELEKNISIRQKRITETLAQMEYLEQVVNGKKRYLIFEISQLRLCC